MATRVESNESEGPGRRGLARYGFFGFLFLAVVELLAHGVMRSRVPTRADWDEAAAFVRARLRERDVIVAAPAWADPLLRLAAGDAIGFAEAGFSDLAGFDRLWALSIRGHLPEVAPDILPAVDRRFGEVRVLRWDLGPSPVRHDFVDHVLAAEVTSDDGGASRVCPLVATTPRGGGLGAGATAPSARFACDPRSSTLWVGETVTEDLSLAPRRCIHQPPTGTSPMRATFRDVPSGERLVLYAGLYYEDERQREHGPFTIVVRRDGAEIGRMVHRDGEGWKRLEIALAPGEASTYSVETTALDPEKRSVCWAATVRGPRRELGE